MHLFDVQLEYKKDAKLKQDDVTQLIDWVHNQPHLPDITELQAIFFLKKAHYKSNPAKITIDSYFSLKNSWPEIFSERTFVNSPLSEVYNAIIISSLPEKTSENHTIIYMKTLSPDIVNYDHYILLRYYDMVSMLDLYGNGSSQGQIILFDMEDFPFSYLPKFDLVQFKRYFYYMQELMPIVELKSIHIINPNSFIKEFLAILESAVPKSLLSLIFVHNHFSSLSTHIPLEILPKEYGGLAASREVLKENIKQAMLQNNSFFEWEKQQTVDESKRPPKNTADIFKFDNGMKNENGAHI